MGQHDQNAEVMLNRFSRLMRDVLRGGTTRTSFALWEVELLLDIAVSGLEGPRARVVLERYRKTVERQLDYGILPPLKLSEYLKQLRPAV